MVLMMKWYFRFINSIMTGFLSRNKDFWVHLSFWCVYLSFHLYQTSMYQRRVDDFNWNKAIMMISLQFSFTCLIAYLGYFFFLPRFLKNKNKILYIAGFLVVFAALITVRVHWQRYLIDGYTHQERYFYSSSMIVQMVAVTLFITIFIGLLRFVRDWFQFEATKKEVETEKLTSELNFLKAQINPHFLFNTLNNLYYLAYTRSENTTEVIAKLSQVMRYMIHDSNHPRVLLTKEIEYMENYISLERLRLNNQIPISLDISGNTEQVQIAPLILITFLENAFKHGVTNLNAQAWVKIRIDAKPDHLLYSVENSKIEQAMVDNGGKSGIGLANVRRRLDLLYPSQYDLKVEETEGSYYIKLKLPVH